ncbi:helix-turn-helix transcriptional regulator [Peptostreptococcus porci]|uniref:helix-turn-helix transcriptional regulator n=1 Tax=Peptostreptococcus porci TaxID=2652282 RepID=UPI002A7F9196|nr:helix-turn-helix domain-containing protein [Peptostreptococcus porci]MDY4127961.1 helix-turn-helix domain-containing protein [Peptostreptococcus porci]
MKRKRVAQYRGFLGYTQSEMAKVLGISLSTYANKERGIYPFSEREMALFKKETSKYFPNITIDDIFM